MQSQSGRDRLSATKRAAFRLGASVLAVAVASPVAAQVTPVMSVRTGVPIVTAPSSGPVSAVRSPSMQQALQNQIANQQRVADMRAMVLSARDAALAATRANPVDGLDARGLDPIATINQAIAAARAGDSTRSNSLLANASAVNDPTGKATWQGAGLPTQTVEGGVTTVTINQTEARALLSWNNFDIGANTVLTFNQKLNGAPQQGWTVVNRVVDSVAPSTVLGSIKADGTVAVLNSRGVIFGQNSQVNLHSLLVSSLEIGAASVYTGAPDPNRLKGRNDNYLQNGLFFDSGKFTPLLAPDYFIRKPSGVTTTIDVPPETVEGGITLDPGARIASGSGGFIILAAPQINSAGHLSATNGQVSLQAGRQIFATASTGSEQSIDPFVRGYVLRSFTPGRGSQQAAANPLTSVADDGSVVNTGLIESVRGYISLGAGLRGSVTNNGLLSATTSVSRNGKVALNAGTVVLGGSSDLVRAGGIAILPDGDGTTIPQGSADSPPNFKSSQIEIGAIGRIDETNDIVGTLVPGKVTFGQNSLLFAPNANVVVGRKAGTVADELSVLPSSIDILSGATIDVGGIKDYQLSASVNSLKISPAKRNELRDTPNYRESAIAGNFTLNGATLYVDPRLSGVRSDGVKWVGSPLLEAGSLASQIPATAAQLMTKGGSVTLSVGSLTSLSDVATAPRILIAPTARIDISGGWINYAAGPVLTSKLVAADGRIVDIGEADPNDIYVSVLNGFTSSQPTFAVSETFTNGVAQANQIEASYDEGRDAGSLIVSAPAIDFAGQILGQAFAGSRQLSEALQPSATDSVASLKRPVQSSPYQLPAGGAVQIGSFSGGTRAEAGGDIVIYRGIRTGGESTVQTLLNDAMLTNAGLSSLTLQTSGSVIFAGAGQALLDPSAATIQGASSVTLASGGTLRVDAGRYIRFDGAISVPSGAVIANTLQLGANGVGIDLTTIGSPYTASDNILPSYTSLSQAPRPFDIDVTGTVSVAGRFINDFGVADQLQGSAWTNGGSISLSVAPNQFASISAIPGGTATDYADLSGSITIFRGALLDVSAGAYVSSLGEVSATARGGNVALSAPTIFAPIVRSFSDGQQIYYNSPLVPTVQRAQVSFDAASLKGFGFSGGGTFSLTAPNISFGSDVAPGSSHVDIDFLQKTGFGTLSLDTFRSVLQPGLFAPGGAPNEALLATTVFRIKSGETLDLTQSIYSNRFSPAQLAGLRGLASGSRLDSVLTPGVPQTEWDRVSANLVLSGLSELNVDAGGSIIGAAGASITAPKIFNDGSIVIHGGTLSQNQQLPLFLSQNFSVGIGGSDQTSLEAAFGQRREDGTFDPDAANAAGLTYDALGSKVAFTNRQLAATGGVYLLGTLNARDAVVLSGRSVTDLSGTAIINPFTGIKRGGAQIIDGRMVAGGRITTSADIDLLRPYFSVPRFGLDPFSSSKPIADALFAGQSIAGSFNALPSATIDLRGSSAIFDIAYTPGDYQPIQQWSNGGTLSVLGGGTISGAAILAQGGASAATGGTLEWLRPTLIHGGTTEAANRLLDSQIAASGFDTLIARGGLTFDGAVSLNLDKALIVSSAPVLAGTIAPNAAADVIVSATNGSIAQVSAPYIRFASLRGSVDLTNIGKAVPNSGTAQVSFNAGAQGIDFFGATLFNGTIESTILNAVGDLRLTGVNTANLSSGAPGTLNGELLTQGNLTVDAARIYATTGTGNLQQILEDQRAGRALDRAALPFEIAAFGNSKITFLGTHLDKRTPFSAGSYLRVQAKTIEQNGFVAAPLGLLQFGGNGSVSIAGQSAIPGSGQVRAIATDSLTFGAGSLTSVSAVDAKIGTIASAIPYGTTTDLTEVFFTPTANDPITSPPTGELIMAGSSISVDAGALVDGRGGGDVFAYEFVSGTGGSRDVLDRFNTDQFSANLYDASTGTGFQFADKRQVFAIIPVEQAQNLAMFDPIYSADYGIGGPVDLYGASAGMAVRLDASDGVPAGEYLLLPAHYALLPGAYRLVENTGMVAPVPGTSQTLLDGSVIVGGNYATAGTSLAESTRRSFTLQSKTAFSKYSQNSITAVSPALEKRASQLDQIRPRLALDSARTIISPLKALAVTGTFDFTAATGGLGTAIDIGGTDIVIGGQNPGTSDGLFLSNLTLDNLNANSLFIGGQRINQSDGSTLLNVTATSITINSDAVLGAPELLFAVGAKDSSQGLEPPALTIERGAVIRATGNLADPRTGDYVIASDVDASPTGPFALTGIGAALRIANGPERLFKRQGDFAARNSLRAATLEIGAATLEGTNIALDSSRVFRISNDAVLAAPNIAVIGDSLRFGAGGFLADIEAKFAAAARLTVRSPDAIGFSEGSHTFNNLTLDSQGIGRVNRTPALNALPVDVTINAKAFNWFSSTNGFSGCVVAGVKACGAAGSSLAVIADTITFGSGQLGVYGFNNQSAVTLAAANGIYIEGKGSLSVGNIAGSARSTDSTLSLVAPFVADRAVIADPLLQKVRPDFQFNTRSDFSLIAPSLAPAATLAVPNGNRAPGARIAIGTADTPAASVSINSAAIIATSGNIDISAAGSIALNGSASLATPGFIKTFGDNVDAVTVSAGGGTIRLLSLGGDISTSAGSSVIVDSGIGSAGSLNLIASGGAVTLGGTLNPGVTGTRTASLAFDAQTSAFDLTDFVNRYGRLFQGDISIRSGAGNLSLAAGQPVRARSFSLTADGVGSEDGRIIIAGTIDTSGRSVAGMKLAEAKDINVNGGNIVLYGNNGVRLAQSAILDTHTTGYLDADTRSASAGNVTLGIGSQGALLAIESGARIDVGARRTSGQTGNRLVAQTVTDPGSLTPVTVYNFVTADQGGTISFRAPVDDATSTKVNISLPGASAFVGASSIQIEGFKRYDLDALATRYSTSLKANKGIPDFYGVSPTLNGVELNLLAGVDDIDENGNSAPYSQTLNILASDFVTADGLQSVAHFVRNFAVTAFDGSSFGGDIRLRPGIELSSSNAITLQSNWNLGAGTVDVVRASEDGVLVSLPGLNFNNGGVDAAGVPYYAVAAGQDANLFQNYTDFTYRVGGKASGEAPVLTLRAAKALTSFYSISDGFFVFRDRSNPDYVAYQLGGDNRTVLPSGTLICGGATTLDCGSLGSFAEVAKARYQEGSFDPTTAATINLGLIGAGDDVSPAIEAPFSQLANSAGAVGGLDVDFNNVGNPLANADLFPLLDGGSAFAKSSSIRLIGGAGEVASANPLHVDRSVGSNVSIAGEHSYRVNALRGTAVFGNDPGTGLAELQLRITASDRTTANVTIDSNFLINAASASAAGIDPDSTGENYTVLNWGNASAKADYLRQAASSYFNLVDGETYDFAAYGALTAGEKAELRVGVTQGAKRSPSGVAARLSDIIGFLNSLDPETGLTVAQTVASRVTQGIFDAPIPVPKAPLVPVQSRTVNYGSFVRTGDGSIDIAAAGDISLLRTPTEVYRSDPNDLATRNLVGGNAVYTAGHEALAAPRFASTADGSVSAAITLTSGQINQANLAAGYLPSPLEQFFVQPKALEQGGAISLSAGRDVLGRQNVWGERAAGEVVEYTQPGSTANPRKDNFASLGPILSRIGSADQRWRTGAIGQDTLAVIAPNLFTSGVGALGGGNINVNASGDVSGLSLALDTSLVTAGARQSLISRAERTVSATATRTAGGALAAPVLVTLGGGNLSLQTGGDLIGGRFDIASGRAQLAIGGDIAPGSKLVQGQDAVDSLRIRLGDATVLGNVGGSISARGAQALGVSFNSIGTASFGASYNSLGNFTAISGVNLAATGAVTLTGDFESAGGDAAIPFGFNNVLGFVLPPSLQLTSFTDDITLTSVADRAAPYLLYPSAIGQLSLLSGGSLVSTSIAMLDSDPSLLPGKFSAFTGQPVVVDSAGIKVPALVSGNSLPFLFPVFSATTPDALLRLFHSSTTLHLGDTDPARIYVDGSIRNSNILLAKQGRIGAGVDIIDTYFSGQNVAATDITRITAGRDIIGSSTSNLSSGAKSFVLGNSFSLGGPGAFNIEAGRNLGPFITSATINGVAYAGGIRTVGNDFNPWLPAQGADLGIGFGIGNGADYAALRETYLNPANFVRLDGDLFEQITDVNGNQSPDRGRPVYAPKLARWLKANAPEAFSAVFGDLTLADDAALTNAAYGRANNLYAAFANLPQIVQNRFLVNTVYFGELAAPADPNGTSFQQYIRGYRAVQALFPTSLGYTDNLAPYTTDPATVSADHPLGVPVRNIVNGEPQVATRVLTGNVDLRLSTIETTRGGDITILGPGGDFIGGSVVRTSVQPSRRVSTAVNYIGGGLPLALRASPLSFTGVPLGFEGILTLRGGSISSYTDGDLRLNQSRLFTQAGGSITLWSSNGNLNAGQGPKSSSNFPPITQRFNPDGLGEVDSAGSVAGAGIGAFKQNPTDPDAAIVLVAPVGEVDAGDAGVRASGNIFVAAARVANADNFQTSGTISGVPSGAVVAAPVTPASAASAVAANAARIAGADSNGSDRTIITVDVTGAVEQACSNEDRAAGKCAAQ